MAARAGDVNQGGELALTPLLPRADLTAGAGLPRRLSLIAHRDR